MRDRHGYIFCLYGGDIAPSNRAATTDLLARKQGQNNSFMPNPSSHIPPPPQPQTPNLQDADGASKHLLIPS